MATPLSRLAPRQFAMRMLAAHLLEVAGVAILLLLAGWLRLGWVGVNSFGFDEARLSLLALQLARDGEVPAFSMQSSTGFPNLAGAVWIMALPYRLSVNPLVATLFVGCLSLLAVLGIWWLARTAWGPWAGWCAGLLLAGSPFAVLYARSIWGQNLLPPLAVLWAVTGFAGIRRGKLWALGVHVFLCGLAFQVHYAGLVLLPATFWLLFRYHLWRRWPAVMVGATAAGLIALPGLLAILHSPDLRRQLLQVGAGQAQMDLSAGAKLAEMGLGANWEWLLLGNQWNWSPLLRMALLAARLAAGVLILAGLVVLCSRAVVALRRRSGAEADAILAALVPAWALASPLAFAWHTTPVYHQYQLASLPALALAGASLASLAPGRRLWTGLVVALALLATLPQVAALAIGLDTVARRLTPGGMGTPLSYPQSAVHELQDGLPIAVHAHGDEPEFEGDAAGFSVLLWNYPHRIVDGRTSLLLPGSGPCHLLFTFADLPAWSEAEAAGLQGRFRLLPRREGEPPYLALTLDRTMPQSFHTVTPMRLANGLCLCGWRISSTEGRLRIVCWWQIGEDLVPGNYHQFNHLRAAAGGDTLAIHDIPTSSQAWQPGDTLITWADLDLPDHPGPFVVQVGMYTWPEVQRVPVLDRPSDPLAPIVIGPIEPD